MLSPHTTKTGGFCKHANTYYFILFHHLRTKKRGVAELTLDLAWKATAREPERRAACGKVRMKTHVTYLDIDAQCAYSEIF